MEKRYLTFVMSYLLLAAFIGSAEAKKIDTGYAAGAGLIQLAVYPGSRLWTGRTATTGLVGEPDGSMEWLLAFYYGTEAGKDFIVLDTSTTPTDEVLPAREHYEEDFSLGEEILMGYHLAGLSGMVYGDRLLDQTAATPTTSTSSAAGDSTAQTTVSASAPEKVPIIASASIPVDYVDRPIIVHINRDPVHINKDPNRVKHRGSSPEKPPKATDPPFAGAQVEPMFIVENPKAQWPKNPEPVYKQQSEPGPNKVVISKNSTNNSPAPVPEPATVLLFSTCIAGLAFNNLRRNKSADKKKKG